MTKLDKPPAYRWVILFIYMVPYCFFFMSLQASSAYGAAIQEEMDISATMASFMLTAAMIGFAFFGFIGGRMQSRFGSKRTMLCGIAVDVLASLLLIPFGSFYPVALALRFVQGVGGGIMATPALMLSTTWFPVRQRALATGILIGVLRIGFTFATLGESLTAGFGLAWNVGMGTLLGIVGVCVLLFFFVAAKDLGDVYPGASTVQELLDGGSGAQGSNGSVDESLPTTMAQARKSKVYLASCVYSFGNAWIVYGFGTPLVQLLNGDLGITSGLVTTIIGSTFFITIVSTPLGGILSDTLFKGSRYQTCVIGAGLTAVALILLVVFGAGAGAFMVGALLVLAFGSNALPLGPMWPMISESVAPAIRSQYTGEMTTICNFGGILAAPILAATLDVTGSAFLEDMTDENR